MRTDLIKKAIPGPIRSFLSSSPAVRQWENRAAGRAYYCKALQGESNYNICINSDLTVSCNCRDYDGSGHIGDLETQSLEEVFHGETAQRFRERLAEGKYAVAQCHGCWELQSIDRRDALSHLRDYDLPRKGIMVENTVLCNLNCIGCNRKQVLATRKRPRMSLADMEKVARTIGEYRIQEVAFHNLGEPFLYDSVWEELTLIRKHHPGVVIVTSTNGMLVDSDVKRGAALLTDQMYFSIDGPSQEVLSKYQVGGDIERVCGNMRALVELRNARGLSRPLIEWKYVVFRWNDRPSDIEAAIRLARETKADMISFWLGGGPPSHVSRRFRADPYFLRLGEASWKGREIDLRRAEA